MTPSSGNPATESRMQLGSKWPLRVVSMLIVAAAWEIFARAENSLLLPTSSDTMVALVSLIGSNRMWEALWVSNQSLMLGFAASLLVGIPLGLAIGRWPLLDKLTNVYLNILLVTPMAALIPLIIIAFGLGLVSRVLFVFVFAVPMVVVNTRTGLRQVAPNLVEMALSFGATERQLWRKIFVPGALPAIMTGVRIGLGRAITGMVVAELLLSAEGIGRLLLQYQGDFESAYVYAVIVVVVAESVLLMRLVKSVEQQYSAWRPEAAAR